MCSLFKETSSNKPVEKDRLRENESTLLHELNTTISGAKHWVVPSCEYGLFDIQCNRANAYSLLY